MGADLLDVIEFVDELDVKHRQIVHYEWKPLICADYKGVGHLARDCRKKQNPGQAPVRKVWVPKETRVRTLAINKVHQSIGSQWNMVHNNDSHEGGRIWIIWDAGNYNVDVLGSEAQVIHTKVTCLPTSEVWWMSMVYEFNRQTERIPLWNSLMNMKKHITGPWVVMGDFNNVLARNERIGSEVSTAEVRDFQNCVDVCGLTDIPAQGAFFTWTNKHEIGDLKFSRIDRALVTDEWLHSFPNTLTIFHPEGVFDHCPCTMTLRPVVGSRKTSFKYFNMWGKDPEFLNIVNFVWSSSVYGYKMFQLVKKLKLLKKPLKELNTASYACIETTTKVALAHLHTVQGSLQADPTNLVLQQAVKEALVVYKDRESSQRSFLTQKAKIQWLRDGDDNTHYFHSVIRLEGCLIEFWVFHDMAGNNHTTSNAIEEAFIKYYEQLLGAKRKVHKVHKGTVQQGKVVTPAQRVLLTSDVTTQEIREALFFIPANKAPGPDGFSSQFFKDSFEVVGKDLIEAVQEFFCSGKMVKQINSTTLTLIPKKARPGTVADFRPIACCNVIYKIISKVICNRLTAALPDIISENQSAFLKGRDCDTLMKACSPRCLMKVDLKKAYDSIEWEFIKQMLQALDFHDKMIHWIMECITTPCRVLACVTKSLEFTFHPLCRALVLNHLCFTDDLLLFYRGDRISVTIILRAFATFSKASGLEFNRDKSDIYFNGMSNEDSQYILDRIRGWGARKVSYAERLVLVQAVLSQLHSFWTRIFVIPATVMDRIDQICRNYLWSGAEDFHKTSHVAWDKICADKKSGGLGIKNGKNWNLAMLGKYVWWLAEKSDHLWIRWVNHMYIKGQSWLDYSPSVNTSWTWRKICQVKDIFKPAYSNGKWGTNVGVYNVAAGYSWLQGSIPKVPWYPIIWNRLNLPKHSLIGWLAIQSRLLTKDRLVRFGIITDGACDMCLDQPEDHMEMSISDEETDCHGCSHV
ncbi:uncharacterized protein LOC141649604 [Silene latifolia]|uniref:uncharacterized protein LOC141649604 n=1 Tax=Silene latifolia TaxID=37657 RepID=UPI003D774EE5